MVRRYLCKFSSIRDLVLVGGSFSSIDLDAVSVLRETLRSLELVHVDGISPASVCDDIAAACPGLKSLSLTNCVLGEGSSEARSERGPSWDSLKRLSITSRCGDKVGNGAVFQQCFQPSS